VPRPPKPPILRGDAVNSHEQPSPGHTIEDIDFSDPGILADIRAVFAVLAEIEPVQTTQQLKAA
jgi:hypothetical protein